MSRLCQFMSLVVIMVCLPSWSSAMARPQPQDLVTDHAKRHSQDFQLTNGQPSGEGWMAFLKKAAAADIVLIGEDHGFKEIANLVEAMVPELHRQGFERFVTEIDPFTVRLLDKLLKTPGTAAIEKHLRDHPYSLPFFTMREEYAITQRLAALLPADRTDFVWGLDQSFVFQTCAVLEQWGMQAQDRKVLDRYVTRCKADEQKFFANLRHPTPQKGVKPFLYTLQDKDFQTLKAQLPAGAAHEGLELLRLSQEIYLGQGGHSHISNRTREELMKNQFDSFTQRTGSWPKFFAKFGSGHLEQGRNQLNIMPLGAHIREMAHYFKKSVFSVMILPAPQSKGRTLFGAVVEAEPITGMEPLYALAKGTRPVIIKLADAVQDQEFYRSWLRYQATVKDSVASNMLFSYDAVIIIPQATPATPFVP